jgi:hypothetical protein
MNAQQKAYAFFIQNLHVFTLYNLPLFANWTRDVYAIYTSLKNTMNKLETHKLHNKQPFFATNILQYKRG